MPSTVAVEVASRKRDEARRLLQDAQGAQRAAQDQLDQLQGYARETEGRWGMRADAAVQARSDVPPLPVHGPAGTCRGTAERG